MRKQIKPILKEETIFFSEPQKPSALILENFFYFLISKITPKGDRRQAVLFYRMIERNYQNRASYYHNFNHISQMLSVAWDIFNHFDKPYLALISIYGHDAVIGPGHEKKCADAMLNLLYNLSFPFEQAVFVRENILATEHFEPPKRMDAKIIADLDLMSLGVNPEIFERNTALLRLESKEKTDEEFKNNTSFFFEKLLRRDFVFKTSMFRSIYEKSARANMQKYLKS